VYREYLPRLSAAHGFHYLDHSPLILPESDLALVGSINWYDYTWSLEELRQRVPDWEERLRTKRFSRGRHNDGRFIRWNLDDVRFTAEVAAALQRHIQEALAQVSRIIVITHHACFYGVNYLPAIGPSKRCWRNMRRASRLPSVATRTGRAKTPFTAFAATTSAATITTKDC
jgi:hypothetical protein